MEEQFEELAQLKDGKHDRFQQVTECSSQIFLVLFWGHISALSKSKEMAKASQNIGYYSEFLSSTFRWKSYENWTKNSKNLFSLKIIVVGGKQINENNCCGWNWTPIQ